MAPRAGASPYGKGWPVFLSSGRGLPPPWERLDQNLSPCSLDAYGWPQGRPLRAMRHGMTRVNATEHSFKKDIER